jgi:transcriptional regulator with XRE-family HTH domain
MSERTKPKDPLDHEPAALTWARERAGLTRAALAAEIGVSAGLVSEWEKGTRNAAPPRIKQLAAALNCPRVVLERKGRATEPKPEAADEEPETASKVAA